MYRYIVEYHTAPSPALAYYEGSVTVYADDETDAVIAARKELARHAPEYRNSIQIDAVYED